MTVEFGMKKSKARFNLLLSGLLALGLSGCATSSSHTPLSLGAIWPNTNFAKVSPATTTTADYLKARYSAQQQALGNAATAYASVSRQIPDDSILLQRAFFYALASGDQGEALRLARKIHTQRLSQQNVEASNDEETEAAAIAANSGLGALNQGLPELLLFADSLKKGDTADARDYLADAGDGVFTRSIVHLLNAWAIYDDAGSAAAIDILRAPDSDIFTGLIPLHQAMMMDVSNASPEATSTAWQVALSGFGQETALRGYGSWLERNSDVSEAERLYRAMITESGLLRRSGRLGLARLGEPVTGESREMLTLAKQPAKPLASTTTQGAAYVFHNFAWAAYEQALTEQRAANRAGFSGFRTFLNTPLAFAQIALLLDPKLDETHYLIGSIYVTYEQYEDAARELAKVSARSPYYEYAMIDRAEALTELGRGDEAKKLLAALIKTDPYSLDAGLRLASFYSDSNEQHIAEEIITTSLTAAQKLLIDPEKPESESVLWRWYFTRGAMRAEADNWQGAEEDLVKARALSPDEPAVLNFLGYTWVERGENLDEAFAMIERALTMQPDSGAITDSLGWAHYQRQDYEQAIYYLELAVQLEVDDAVITDHLGDAYAASGRNREAIFEWRRALDFNPDKELRAKIEDKLQSQNYNRDDLVEVQTGEK